MPAPFTPFPIFAPYEDWKPVGSTDVPENLDVRRRLDQVEPACQAYLSILCCSHFLEYLSHRWTPGRAKVLYTETCRYLEQMLNWSFKTGISLLDWETPNFLQFLDFLCHPPIDWCATASNQKYMLSTGQAFRNRPINDRWNIFYRHNDLLHTLAKSRPLITFEPHELDWAFQQIADGAVPILRPEQILFYMAIARFSAIKISHVQSLSQFQKNPDGVWVFDNGLVPTTMMELSQEFSAHLERYLQWYALDPNEPLPSVPAFPTNDGSQSYVPDALHQHQVEYGKRLADAAFACADAAIARAESKFRHMLFTTIRRSTSFTHKARVSEYQAQYYRERVQKARVALRARLS